jgi:hypothetical protein
MSSVAYPLKKAAARRERVLLDTADRFDAFLTGRDGPQDVEDGEDGLKAVYDGTGSIPTFWVKTLDGWIEFRGVAEIRQIASTSNRALRYAEAFGPPLTPEQWRRQNE